MENERNLLREKLSRLEKQELTLIEDGAGTNSGGGCGAWGAPLLVCWVWFFLQSRWMQRCFLYRDVSRWHLSASQVRLWVLSIVDVE